MRTYTLRLTLAEWRAVENGLRNLPHDTNANTALSKIEIANEVLATVKDGAEDEEDDHLSNGGSNGSSCVNAVPSLSRRELLILKALTLGQSNKEIARKLVITESTVKVHMKAVLRKLRLGNRTQAAMWAKSNLNEPAIGAQPTLA